MNLKSNINFAFFGTDNFSTTILDELENAGFLPKLIVTAPDRKQGRGLILTPPPVKIWAEEKNIDFIQPEKLDEVFIDKLKISNWDLFVVASYGKIISKEILDIPKKGTLNVHPSLLPKYRGASPIESQILNDEQEIGVTIMLMDEQMDHGDILDQVGYDTEHNEHRTAPELTLELARRGGVLLAKIIPDWIDGKIESKPQDHSKATFTKKIKKEDGEIKLDEDDFKNYLKYLAYQPWPGVFFFAKNKDGKEIRVKVVDAEFAEGEFRVIKVIPESGHEIPYSNLNL